MKIKHFTKQMLKYSPQHRIIMEFTIIPQLKAICTHYPVYANFKIQINKSIAIVNHDI